MMWQKSREIKSIPLRDKTLLFFNYVSSDGFGDLGHLIDIANPATLQKLSKSNLLGQDCNYQPVYIICCSDASPARLRFIIDALEDNNLAHPIKNPYDKNKQFSHYIENFLKHNPHIYLCTDDEDAKPLVPSVTSLLKNEKFLQQINQGCSAYKISAPIKLFDSVLNEANIFCSELLEHSINDSANRFHQHMGFNRTGILLKSPSSQSLESKAEVLLRLHNKAYLFNLLEQKEESTLTKKVALTFLKANLFIPGYFQDPIANALFINTLAIASESKKYDTVVFHVNGKEFDPTLLSTELLAQEGIAKITLYGPNRSPETIALKNPTGKRRIKIFSDYWLTTNDYEALYKMAQLFGGCSGDKTLELALSNNLIPFYEERAWKQGFSAELATLVEDNDPGLDIFSLHLLTYINFFAKIREIEPEHIEQQSLELSQVIHEDFIHRWQEVIKIIHAKYNLTDKLPSILQAPILVHDFLTAITEKNEATASKILQYFNDGEIREIAHWALAHQFNDAVAFIASHKKEVFELLQQDKAYSRQNKRI